MVSVEMAENWSGQSEEEANSKNLETKLEIGGKISNRAFNAQKTHDSSQPIRNQVKVAFRSVWLLDLSWKKQEWEWKWQQQCN